MTRKKTSASLRLCAGLSPREEASTSFHFRIAKHFFVGLQKKIMDIPALVPGIRGSETITVTPADTAARYGSGLIEVFATPAMVALMEQTAQRSVQALLPEGAITLGTEINVTHVKATPVGMKVTCTTVLTGTEGRRLTFSVQARDELGLIGEGTHRRFIVDALRFMKKLAQP